MPSRKLPKGRRKITTIFDKVKIVGESLPVLGEPLFLRRDRGKITQISLGSLFRGKKREFDVRGAPPLSPAKRMFQISFNDVVVGVFFLDDKITPGFIFFSYFYRKHHDFVRYWSTRVIGMHLVFEPIIPGSKQEDT